MLIKDIRGLCILIYIYIYMYMIMIMMTIIIIFVFIKKDITNHGEKLTLKALF